MKLYTPKRRPLPIPVLELDQPALTPEMARSLLRRLRDLHLSTGPIAIRAGRTVAFDGCLSLDAPVEHGVRYRLSSSDGPPAVLELGLASAGLVVTLSDDADGAVGRRLAIPLSCDGKGRACARLLAARVAPESRDRRELEHFLRRVVRTVAA